MDEILQSIGKAESEASEIKQKALEKALEIAKNAEADADKILKANESECRLYRETQIRNAEKKAEEDYARAIEKKSAEAKAYADGVLKTSDNFSNEIVRRIVSGNR